VGKLFFRDTFGPELKKYLMDTKDDKNISWQDDLQELIRKKEEESEILRKLEETLQKRGKKREFENDDAAGPVDDLPMEEHANHEQLSQE
jgi:hypothetical protein